MQKVIGSNPITLSYNADRYLFVYFKDIVLSKNVQLCTIHVYTRHDKSISIIVRTVSALYTLIHIRMCVCFTESSFMVKLTFMPLALFVLGILGIYLNRRNILVMIMSVELILLAVNLNFLLFSVYLDDLMGQVFSLIILTVAAAESAIGLALLVVHHRVRGRISVEFINLLKG